MNDRSKKSWREVDSSRDRSRPFEPRRDTGGEHPAASKQHRAALEALFARGDLGEVIEKLAPPVPESVEPRNVVAAPETKLNDELQEGRVALRKKLMAAIGRDDISRAVDRYIKTHGMPTDFEMLEQALEHHKPERVTEVVAALLQLLERERPKRSRTLQSKLRLIEETCGDAELAAQAQAARAQLG